MARENTTDVPDSIPRLDETSSMTGRSRISPNAPIATAIHSSAKFRHAFNQQMSDRYFDALSSQKIMQNELYLCMVYRPDGGQRPCSRVRREPHIAHGHPSHHERHPQQSRTGQIRSPEVRGLGQHPT